MYSSRAGLVLAFHGCDESVVEDVFLNKTFLKASENSYDWLGHGVYFWENDPQRALRYAIDLQQKPEKSKSEIRKPSVIGAVIDLGYCLDLTNFENLKLLRRGYEALVEINKVSNLELPQNKAIGQDNDLLLRYLDCAVIETIHKMDFPKSFDSVKGVFWEGKELYPNAGFKEKNHVQICVRNPNCIKGYFLPLEENTKWPTV